MMQHEWYEILHTDDIDSPALLIYKDRVKHNIDTMIKIAGNAGRLMPHVKTHKMEEIVRMQLQAGIQEFKCATIPEAEMLVKAGATDILLAYQLIMPKILRWLTLVKSNPSVRFASLVDNMDSARLLNDIWGRENLVADVFIDVDAGMHRTGIAPGQELFDLYKEAAALPHLNLRGLHVYDGHIREKDFAQRKKQAEEGMKAVLETAEKIKEAGFPAPVVIAGGTPSFTVHALNPEVICSPGTCVLWDHGYASTLPEQPFAYGALLLTRAVSKPQKGIITTDLGHKSVGAENPIDKRIFFLNLADYTVRSQSEEHLVVEVTDHDWQRLRPGDVLYGIPYHVCPSVALYDEAYVIEDGACTGKWNIEARRKRITI